MKFFTKVFVGATLLTNVSFGTAFLPRIADDSYVPESEKTTIYTFSIDLGYSYTEVDPSELSIEQERNCIEVRFKDNTLNHVMWDCKRGITVPDLSEFDNFNSLNLRVDALLYDFGRVFGFISRGLKSIGLTMKSRLKLRDEGNVNIKMSDIISIKENCETLNISDRGISYIENLIKENEGSEIIQLEPNFMIDNVLPSLIRLYEIHTPLSL